LGFAADAPRRHRRRSSAQLVSQIEMVCGVPVAAEPLALADNGAYAQNGIS
jgi:hypothetical protein